MLKYIRIHRRGKGKRLTAALQCKVRAPSPCRSPPAPQYVSQVLQLSYAFPILLRLMHCSVIAPVTDKSNVFLDVGNSILLNPNLTARILRLGRTASAHTYILVVAILFFEAVSHVSHLYRLNKSGFARERWCLDGLR
jgi:hypothetical protein